MSAAGESPAVTALKAVLKLYGDEALDEIFTAFARALSEPSPAFRQGRLTEELSNIIVARIRAGDIGKGDA